MGLVVYKGHRAVRQYENSFFRVFASTLSALFERQGMNGVLVGFPEVFGDEYLEPDVVLITENRILIIDFKNWKDTTVFLPEESEFKTAPWRTSSGDIVKGGKAPNPFAQLLKQNSRFESLIGKRPNEDVSGIGRIVLFQGDINISGEIPDLYSGWFSIADAYSFGNVVYDMIDVESREKNNPEEFRKKYFNATEYLSDIPVIDPDIYISTEKASAKVDEAIRERDEALKAFNDQKEENKRLRTMGESVEKGMRAVQEKEAILKDKEKALKIAQDNFDKEKNAYNVALAELEAEQERTIQEKLKTEQIKHEHKIEREKTKQVEAQAHIASMESENIAKSEKRKRIVSLVLLVLVGIAIFIFALYKTIDFISTQSEKQTQKESEIQALIDEKKSGKACIGLDELSDFENIPNICVEYVVGNVSESRQIIFLNHTANTDFATIIWKKTNLITFADAKAEYLNKKVRVRGKITFYDSEKYKYYEISLNDLSQIEVIE